MQTNLLVLPAGDLGGFSSPELELELEDVSVSSIRFGPSPAVSGVLEGVAGVVEDHQTSEEPEPEPVEAGGHQVEVFCGHQVEDL